MKEAALRQMNKLSARDVQFLSDHYRDDAYVDGMIVEGGAVVLERGQSRERVLRENMIEEIIDQALRFRQGAIRAGDGLDVAGGKSVKNILGWVLSDTLEVALDFFEGTAQRCQGLAPKFRRETVLRVDIGHIFIEDQDAAIPFGIERLDVGISERVPLVQENASGVID